MSNKIPKVKVYFGQKEFDNLMLKVVKVKIEKFNIKNDIDNKFYGDGEIKKD